MKRHKIKRLRKSLKGHLSLPRTIAVLVVLGFLVAGLVFVIRQYTPKTLTASGPSPYGVLVNGIDQSTPREEIARKMQAVKDAGATWVRTDFWFYSVKREAATDPYNWTFFDNVVQEASSRGLKIIPILWGTPPWAKASGNTTTWDPYATPRMDYWQDFVANTVDRYKGTIREWEIWNEPDLNSFFNPVNEANYAHEYATILAGASTVIKMVDPTAKVWLGGLAQGGDFVPDFLQQILSDSDYPAGNYYDVHNIHTNFGTMAHINDQITTNQNILASFGLTKPFVVTENSYTSNPTYQNLAGYQDGEAGQARYVSDSYSTIINRGVEVVVWASLLDQATTTSEYSQSGLLRNDYSIKQAYTTYQQMAGSTPTPTPTPTPSPTPDTTAPTITITSPADGSRVTRNTTVTIRATASDEVGGSGMDKVEFYVNSTLKCTDTSTPFTCNWQVPGGRGIVYTLQAKAYDVAGNNSTNSVQVTSR